VIAARLERVTYAYPEAPGPSLRDVSTVILEGELVVLAGPSGGGKTTLLRAIAGLVPAFHGGRLAGRVTCNGVTGIAFQDPEAQGVYRDVVRDVAFGLENRAWPRHTIVPAALDALTAVRAEHLAGRTLDTLSGGELQRVALAGVLAPRPSLLLLDEPTSQLDDDGAAAIVRLLHDLAATGVAVVVAEHRVDRFAAVAQRIAGLEDGQLTDYVPPVTHAAPPTVAGSPLLVAEGVTAERGDGGVSDTALTLGRGEIVALHGANGAGKTTLLRALAGLDAVQAGSILLDGVDVTAWPAEQRHPGIALVPQDPGRYLLRSTVAEEVGSAAPLSALGLDGLGDRHPLDLSVGQRERVAIAAALAYDPAVLMLDEPTRGMDAGRRGELAAVLRGRAADGHAVLVATHDAGFAAACGARRLVLRDRRLYPAGTEVPA
jgi:energy-coupling factor transport system ATP-binding protein